MEATISVNSKKIKVDISKMTIKELVNLIKRFDEDWEIEFVQEIKTTYYNCCNCCNCWKNPWNTNIWVTQPNVPYGGTPIIYTGTCSSTVNTTTESTTNLK